MKTLFQKSFIMTSMAFGALCAGTAQAQVAAFNSEHGVNADAALMIVTSSMFPAAPIKIEDIYRANGEELK